MVGGSRDPIHLLEGEYGKAGMARGGKEIGKFSGGGEGAVAYRKRFEWDQGGRKRRGGQDSRVLGK